MIRFLVALLAVGLTAFSQEPPQQQLPAEAVVFRTSPGRPLARPDEEPLGAAADRLAMALSGAASPAAAWRALAGEKPGTVLVQAPAAGLLRPGEADFAETVAARIRKHAGKGTGVRLWRGAARPEDFDPKAGFDLPVAGKLIWGDLMFRGKDTLSPRSHFAKAVAAAVRIVNVAPMRASESCGVAGAIFNATCPNLDNSRRITAPPGNGDPYLPEVLIREELYPKLAAHFLDGRRIQFAGGMQPEPNYQTEHGFCYASLDPVALDSLVLREIEPLRKAAKLPPLAPLATFLDTAEAMGVGVADPGRITVKDLPR